MIIVGGPRFDQATAKGLQVNIDDDRGVQLWVDARGNRKMKFKNGQRVNELLLSEEGGLALLELLAASYWTEDTPHPHQEGT